MGDDKVLVEISLAEQALQRADNIVDILILRDKAAALQLFTNAQGFKEAAQKAKVFQLRAERKAGAWLAENVSPGNPQLSQDGIIERLPDGITLNESHRWQQEARLPEDRFNQWVDECLSNGQELSASGLRADEQKGQCEGLIRLCQNEQHTR